MSLKSNCFLSHQCRKPGCNLRHTLISITRLCESEVPAIKVVNGNTFHVNYCTKHTCCYFVFIIFLMATNINFVWQPFYNFRLPKGDFRKNIELEVLHWRVYSNNNKIIAMALIALCTDSKNRLRQTRPLHDSVSLCFSLKGFEWVFPECWVKTLMF